MLLTGDQDELALGTKASGVAPERSRTLRRRALSEIPGDPSDSEASQSTASSQGEHAITVNKADALKMP